MQKKVFWISFTVLGICADTILPLMWGIALTLPLMIGCYWLAYRSTWFD